MEFKYSDYSIDKKKDKNIRFFRIILLIILVLFVLTGVLSVFFINKFIKHNNKNKKDIILHEQMFLNKNYYDLIRKLDSELKENPVIVDNLIYRGYSYFLLGEDENDLIKKKKYFTLSLFDLRKAMAIGINKKNLGDVYFCIGKIYYYLGPDYYYQSLDYLNRSIVTGNNRPDLYYILGILYTYLGKYEESIEIYTEAIKDNESELFLLAIANSYFLSNNYEKSKLYIERIIKDTNDNKMLEKSYYLMGEIFFNEKRYDDALEYFDKVVELNENNAQAYFYRGEIFNLQNNLIKARAEWRKTLEIDPSHIKALKRIYY